MTQEQQLAAIILAHKVAADPYREVPPQEPVPIISAGWSSSGPSYGTLVTMGYMTKERWNPSRHDPDNINITWSTTPEARGITFINSHNETFSHPHTETWEK